MIPRMMLMMLFKQKGGKFGKGISLNGVREMKFKQLERQSCQGLHKTPTKTLERHKTKTDIFIETPQNDHLHERHQPKKRCRVEKKRECNGNVTSNRRQIAQAKNLFESEDMQTGNGELKQQIKEEAKGECQAVVFIPTRVVLQPSRQEST